MDRKTKKRMQNRIAQRTYRNRVKQRLDELQRQVNEHEHERTEAGRPPNDQENASKTNDSISGFQGPSRTTLNGDLHAQQFSRKIDDSIEPNAQAPWLTGSEDHEFPHGDGSTINSFAWNTRDLDMLPRASFNVIDYSSVPPPQHPLQSNLELGSPTKPPSYNQSPYSNRRPGTTQRASATGTVTDSSSLPRESGRGQTDAHVDLPERAQPSGSHTVAESYLSTSFESQAEASRTAAHCGHANPQSWTLPTPSNATSDITADVEGAPGADATMEERFAYLMACARRVGFDGFDDLASRYYAMNFDHASVLALDQRMSRHRGLPMLLTELRQRSTQWMPWERRGYEDEILKSAEQLCASECEEFRNDENMMQSQSVVEMTLQDNLPKLWALLAGMNIKRAARSRTCRVYMHTTVMWLKGYVFAEYSLTEHWYRELGLQRWNRE